jgi:lipoate-protein ligase A
VIHALRVAYDGPVSYADALDADGAALGIAGDERDRGVLRLRTGTGVAVLVGRYHLVPERIEPGTAPVPVHRRRTGGRVMPFGEGFLGLSLLLPHRSALVSEEWLALAPEQVMNRCVRGILHGLRDLGVPAFYPGRDLITAGGRALGVVSFEVAPQGALLFEGVLAANADLAVAPRLLDRVDPEGVIKTGMMTPGDVTTVSAAAGRAIEAAEVGERIAAGYAAAFGLALEPAVAGMAVAATRGERDPAVSLHVRRPRPDLDRRSVRGIQLGVLEVHAARAGDRLAAVMLAGDFIANSAAVERLERALIGVPCEWGAVSAQVFAEFGRPESFLLGVGDLAILAHAICDSVEGGSRDRP